MSVASKLKWAKNIKNTKNINEIAKLKLNPPTREKIPQNVRKQKKIKRRKRNVIESVKKVSKMRIFLEESLMESTKSPKRIRRRKNTNIPSERRSTKKSMINNNNLFKSSRLLTNSSKSKKYATKETKTLPSL